MPKPTFNNLPETKRKHFIRESYIEFGLHSYESASITNLVRRLGIAKGSVYQYFDDKRDLYQFLVIEASRQLETLEQQACPYNNEPFFDWYLKLVMVEVKFYFSFPQYAILFQQVLSTINNDLKDISVNLSESWKSRIEEYTPVDLSDSTISMNLLVTSPLQIFNLATKDLNLARIINNGDPVSIETKELVNLCSAWVDKLKSGLFT